MINTSILPGLSNFTGKIPLEIENFFARDISSGNY